MRERGHPPPTIRYEQENPGSIMSSPIDSIRRRGKKLKRIIERNLRLPGIMGAVKGLNRPREA